MPKIGNFARRRDVELGHGNDYVRRSSVRIQPAFGKLWQRRQVGIASFRRSGVHPRDNGVDFLLGQPRVVAKLYAVIGIGWPRRHLALGYLLLDRLGPWTTAVVRQQRNSRPDLSRAMTTRAMFEQDWRYFASERRHGVARRRSFGAAPNRKSGRYKGGRDNNGDQW